MYFLNGDRFMGGWDDGKMEGEGTYFWRAGDRYEGSFRNNLKEGQGSFVSGDLREYKGDFAADKMEGQGRMTFPEGHVYEGGFADWKRSGTGTMTRRNGDVYVGAWNDEAGEGKVLISFLLSLFLSFSLLSFFGILPLNLLHVTNRVEIFGFRSNTLMAQPMMANGLET